MIIKTRLKRNKHLYKSFYFLYKILISVKTNIIYVFLPFTAFTTYYIKLHQYAHTL